MATGGSLLAGLDDRVAARSSLPLGRFPGRVWMMMLVLLLSSVKISIPMISGTVDASQEYARFALLAFALGSFIAMWILGARTAGWFLRVQVLVGILGLCVLSYSAPSTLGLALIAWGFMAFACYSACWFTWRFTVFEVLFTAVAYLVTLLLLDQLAEMFALWLVVVASTFAFGLVLSLLMRRMRELIMVDPLTGLINRKGLEAVIEALQGSGPATPRSLVVIDLDAFKRVNDQRGHQAGDEMLRDFSEGLRGLLRPDDIAVRSGGDEFLLILPRTDIPGAEGLMRRLQHRIPIPHSFGVAEWNGDSAFDLAVAEADRLMYSQKSRRREQPA